MGLTLLCEHSFRKCTLGLLFKVFAKTSNRWWKLSNLENSQIVPPDGKEHGRVSGVTPPLWLFRGGHLRFSCPSTFKFHPLCGGWILCKMNVLGCLARFYGFSK